VSPTSLAPRAAHPHRGRRVAIGLVLVSALLLALVQATGFVRIALGYASVVAAGQHFLSGESLDTIERERVPGKIGFVRIELDEVNRTATARAFGLERTSRFRPGLGATRERGASPDLPDRVDVERRPLPPDEPWPLGSSPSTAQLPASVDAAALEAALDDAFVERETGLSRATHAVCVVWRGELVAERYAPGYERDTPLLGWSMSKSVTAALIGRLVHEGSLRLDDPAPVPLWSAANDPRRVITIDDLLRMRSGLAFFQNHVLPWADSLRMLFASVDCGAYAAGMPLEHEPGTVWSYSDGTSNVLAGIVRRTVGGELEQQLAAPYELLFEPVGMRTATVCVDGSGTFVGSSLVYASARDWARFGWLFAGDGTWNGRRLLPEGFVDYVSSRTEGSKDGCYGAHFWRYDEESGRDGFGNDVPVELRGLFYASGYQRQVVLIDRRRQLVLVRLGVDPRPPGFDVLRFAGSLVAVFDAAEREGADRSER